MALYTATIFLGAFLLFQVQPLIAKLVLPWFGGAASVWVTALLFFQLLLLGGYLYAHGLVSRIPPRRQVMVQTVLLGASLLVLPVTLPLGLRPDGTEASPFLLLLAILFLTVGMPYFLLSTASPLLQAWYARTHVRALPYRLFALSNLASLLGLIAYPFLVEPNIPLRVQRVAWSGAYAACVILFITTALFARRSRDERAEAEEGEADALPRPSWAERLRWLLLAACPSMLLMSVTSHLTQNVASVPFLWVLPLSLYLLTFIIAFDLERFYHRKIFAWLTILALVVMAHGLRTWGVSKDIWTVIAVFSSGLFLCSLACHGELSRRKPHPRHLTSFYTMLSAGGAVGGLLVGFLAPLVLPGAFELELSLIFCAGLVLFILGRGLGRVILVAGICATVMVIAAAVLFIDAYFQYADVTDRNFYGSIRVYEHDAGTPAGVRTFFSGIVDHGRQFTAPERRREPLTYFSRDSGIGIVLQQLHRPSERIGVIGLGIGTLAAYARPGDVVRFYEINPAVERIARSYFTYLADCAGKVEVVLGDGRLSLEQEQDQHFDVLAIDAFSGDAVPAHLLTREAVRLYLRHLTPDGILAFNITNMHVDLAPLILALSRDLGRPALFYTNLPDEERQIASATWAFISARRLALPALAMAAWVPDERPGVHIWTDDFNDLFGVLK